MMVISSPGSRSPFNTSWIVFFSAAARTRLSPCSGSRRWALFRNTPCSIRQICLTEVVFELLFIRYGIRVGRSVDQRVAWKLRTHLSSLDRKHSNEQMTWSTHVCACAYPRDRPHPLNHPLALEVQRSNCRFGRGAGHGECLAKRLSFEECEQITELRTSGSTSFQRFAFIQKLCLLGVH